MNVSWEPAPQSVLVVATPHNAAARAALPTVIATLRRLREDLDIYVETPAMARLVKDTTVSVATPATWSPDAYRDGLVEGIDLIISLGGDGLILHVVSALFPREVPPIMPFNLGSMGFLTPFALRDHERHIGRVLAGENNSVTMRMRLKCVVVPKGEALEDQRAPVRITRDESGSVDFGSANSSDEDEPELSHDYPTPSPLSASVMKSPQLKYRVLNEIVIDRGPAPYLSNLEVLADDSPITRVQADGIIIATPTGSTAYSMSSGGSMVHPSVPALLFTPICPHSLSFRPVLFPHDAVLQIKVPDDARATAWVSFDGRHRMELMRGDRVVVWASDYPVPTFSAENPMTDWFKSVSHCLRWNERIQQTAFSNGDDDEEEGEEGKEGNGEGK